MKRLLPDTIFARLFALVVLAIVVSHLATFAVLFAYHEQQPPFDPHPDVPLPVHLEPIPGHAPPAQVWMNSATMPPAHNAMPPPKHRLPPGLWIGLITQLIALTVAAWFGARVLVRPIQRQAHATALLGETLNSPLLDEEDGPVEARQAAQVFNQMQQRIRSHIEERERFLAAVSHDLRTPLTRMRLRLENYGENASKDKLTADIEEMAVMLDATLDYLRGQSIEEDRQMLDIHALLDSMVEDSRESGREVTLSGMAQPIMTRPLTLRRALSNLIENALRYGHQAAISLHDSAHMLAIEVRDAGQGIPPDKIKTVFEPFVRLESSRNKAYGGVGLGLSIAQEAARQCGGELTLRNAEEGGLVATISLRRES